MHISTRYLVVTTGGRVVFSTHRKGDAVGRSAGYNNTRIVTVPLVTLS